MSSDFRYALVYYGAELDENFGPFQGMSAQTAILLAIFLAPLILSLIISTVRMIYSQWAASIRAGVERVEDTRPRKILPRSIEPAGDPYEAAIRAGVERAEAVKRSDDDA